MGNYLCQETTRYLNGWLTEFTLFLIPYYKCTECGLVNELTTEEALFKELCPYKGSYNSNFSKRKLWLG